MLQKLPDLGERMGKTVDYTSLFYLHFYLFS